MPVPDRSSSTPLASYGRISTRQSVCSRSIEYAQEVAARKGLNIHYADVAGSPFDADGTEFAVVARQVTT